MYMWIFISMQIYSNVTGVCILSSQPRAVHLDVCACMSIHIYVCTYIFVLMYVYSNFTSVYVLSSRPIMLLCAAVWFCEVGRSWVKISKFIVAVCCCVLQCVAVCCSVLQCVAVCCSVLQCVEVCCSVLQFAAVCRSVLSDIRLEYSHCCSVLQCVAVCCRVLQLSQRVKPHSLRNESLESFHRKRRWYSLDILKSQRYNMHIVNRRFWLNLSKLHIFQFKHTSSASIVA